METSTSTTGLFCDYYAQWVKVYKDGAIRNVTMRKYELTMAWLRKLVPALKLADLDRIEYQKLINGYAEHHERQTTMDFHHQLKGAILDAVDEGLIGRDPTRKVIIKGRQPRQKKIKYLNQFELHAMLSDLDLGPKPSWDWLILLVAKTGLRFSEALGLTPDDFDFVHQTLSVNKTWDYKNGGGFVPTKNASSVCKVQLDWQLIMQLSALLKDLPRNEPIFARADGLTGMWQAGSLMHRATGRTFRLSDWQKRDEIPALHAVFENSEETLSGIFYKTPGKRLG